MSVRSLNKVILIGNLTRDPELRYTPAGTAVCTFGLATNRQWTTQTGETKEETEFHRIVAWNKLGELCSQLLSKGRKVYVEGRLATHSWTAQDGAQRTTTEVVIDDMIILDSKKRAPEDAESSSYNAPRGNMPQDQGGDSGLVEEVKNEIPARRKTQTKVEKNDEKVKANQQESKSEEITPDDIPF